MSVHRRSQGKLSLDDIRKAEVLKRRKGSVLKSWEETTSIVLVIDYTATGFIIEVADVVV